MNITRRPMLPWPLLIVVLLLSACGKSGGDAGSPTDKVAAITEDLQQQAVARTAARPPSPEDLAAAQRKLDAIYVDLELQETPFPSFYRIHDRSSGADSERSTRLVDADVTAIANNGERGWQGINNTALSEERRAELFRKIADELDISQAIVIRHGGDKGPAVLAIYSAIECPACVALEKFLSRQKITYAIFPTSLAEENQQDVEGLWCHSDREAAWKKLMLEREAIFEPGHCNSYPRQYIELMANAFELRSFPTIIFRDGGIQGGLRGDQGEQQLLERIQQNIASGAVYSTGPRRPVVARSPNIPKAETDMAGPRAEQPAPKGWKSQGSWKSLSTAMQKEQVRQLLGEPHQTSSVGAGADSWKYHEAHLMGLLTFRDDKLESWIAPSF